MSISFFWNRFWKCVRSVFLFLLVSSVLAVLAFKWVPVYYTPLMFIRYCEQWTDGKDPRIEHEWVDLDRISHNLAQAVVASEDQKFLDHNGFDEREILKARMEALNGGRERGASSISQQTAKNVFLWPGHNWLRKGLEAYFTVLIENIWGKERIMEVYLNSIEMGDGIYGAEACARENFGTTAEKLTKKQAATIAATLPNPLRYDSAHPSKHVNKRQAQIANQMGKVKTVPWGAK